MLHCRDDASIDMMADAVVVASAVVATLDIAEVATADTGLVVEMPVAVEVEACTVLGACVGAAFRIHLDSEPCA